MDMRHHRWRWAVIFLSALMVHLFLQGPWAHRSGTFVSAGPPAALSSLLAQQALSPQDYDTLFLETGLSPWAVDHLLSQGADGAAQILAAQQALRAPEPVTCTSLIAGRITCEELSAGPGAPLAPLTPGDLLVTFSTHTAGWRHGHAGLVMEDGDVLEASHPGAVSGLRPASRWRRYASFLVLRVRDAGPEARGQAVQFAQAHLEQLPYGLLCGLWSADGEGLPHRVHCAYLPWRAWAACGYDLDGDGGISVTVADLTASPLLEVVQVAGMDPAPFLSRAAGRGQISS